MSGRDLRTTTAGQRGAPVTIYVEGQAVEAYEGESVAAALLAMAHRTFRVTDRAQAPRSYYCGMGVCHDCLVILDGEWNVRACMSRVRPGLRIERQRGLGIGAHP
jgi:hypothetical protein